MIPSTQNVDGKKRNTSFGQFSTTQGVPVPIPPGATCLVDENSQPDLNKTNRGTVHTSDERGVHATPEFGAGSSMNQDYQVFRRKFQFRVPDILQTVMNINNQYELITKNSDTKEVENNFKRNAESPVSTRPEKRPRFSIFRVKEDFQVKLYIPKYSNEFSEYNQYLSNQDEKMSVSDIHKSDPANIDKTEKSISPKHFKIAGGLDSQNNQNPSMVLANDKQLQTIDETAKCPEHEDTE